MQPEGRLGDQAQRALRPGEQLADVVAGHVLDHLAAGVRDHPVRADRGDPDQQVARGPVPQPARPRRPGGDHSAHRRVRRGVQRELLPGRGQHRRQLPEGGPGLHPGDQVPGRMLDDLIHRPEVHHQVAGRRGRAPGQPHPGAARHHRQPGISRGPQQRRGFGRAGRPPDEGRRPAADRIGRLAVPQRRARGAQR
jgi:hypothetical protein